MLSRTQIIVFDIKKTVVNNCMSDRNRKKASFSIFVCCQNEWVFGFLFFVFLQILVERNGQYVFFVRNECFVERKQNVPFVMREEAKIVVLYIVLLPGCYPLNAVEVA